MTVREKPGKQRIECALLYIDTIRGLETPPRQKKISKKRQ